MSLPPFSDGFPTDSQQAVAFSYFLTPSEKEEWKGWLSKANDTERDELVEILHDMWIQAKQDAIPAEFGQPQPQVQQQSQPQNQQVRQSYQQAQFVQSQQQNLAPTQAVTQNTEPTQQFQTYSQPQPQTIPQTTQINPQIVSQTVPTTTAEQAQFNPFASQPISQPTLVATPPIITPESISQMQPFAPQLNPMTPPPAVDVKPIITKEPAYSPNPIIADPKNVAPVEFKATLNKPPLPIVEEMELEDDFNFETEEEVVVIPKPQAVKTVVPVISTQNVANPTNLIEEEHELGDFDFEKDEADIKQKSSAQRKTSGIDFSTIRENSSKTDLANIKQSFIEARQSHETVLEGFVDKVTEILSNFEDINDYIEAMTDKVLNINDEVVNQSQDIQALKSATQVRGPALQDQCDEIRYDLEKIAKELRNARIEMKRSNDEIRQRLSILESDSFRQANDGIEARLALIKSDMSKMQEVLNNISNNQLHQTGNNFSLPTQNPRISRLDAVAFRK